MKSLIFIFIGGGLGSILRYGISKLLVNTQQNFPLGTFVVNVLGSFLIGCILGYAAKNTTISQHYILLLATGFCGGFTTFSTFAYENFTLLKSGDLMTFILYTVASFVVGLLAVFLGLILVK